MESAASLSKLAVHEKGGWEACVEVLRKNEAKAAKFSFKNLEEHAQEFAQALSKNTSVQFIDLSCNGFSATGAGHIAKALLQNKTLRAIDLSANAIQSPGTVLLVKAMIEHPLLEWVDLHANSIHDDAVPAIAEFLAKSEQLKSLNIRANYFTDKSVEILADVLCDEAKCTIHQIDFGSNDFSPAGEAALVAAAKANSTVQSLHQTTNTMLSDVGCVVS